METRLTTPTAILAIAIFALTACAGSSGSATGQSEATTQDASASSTRTITDRAGSEIILPEKITRVAIGQAPTESAYLTYFDGKTPYLVSMNAARIKTMSRTIAAEMTPETIQVGTSCYDKDELNAEVLLNLNADVVFYNAFSKKHNEMLRKTGIPTVGFTTLGSPSEIHAEWMGLLEDVFNEDGHMANKIALGRDLTADTRARIAKVPADQEASTMVLMGAAGDQFAATGGKDGQFTDEWIDSLSYTSITCDTDTSHTPVTLKQVLTWDPQILLVTGKGISNITANTVLTDSIEGIDLSILSSMKSGRIYSAGLDMWNWFIPNPDSPVVVSWIGASLYPEQFSGIDLVSMTKNYCQKMYNFTLTGEQAQRIIDPDSASQYPAPASSP